MICAGVPQPWDGRCWNRPNESWSLASPRSGRLIREDSWIATATAMIQPRAGTPMRAPTPMMVAALPTASEFQAPIAGKPPGGGLGTPAGMDALGLTAVMAAVQPLATPVNRTPTRPAQATTMATTPPAQAARSRGLRAASLGWVIAPGAGRPWWPAACGGAGSGA